MRATWDDLSHLFGDLPLEMDHKFSRISGFSFEF
jgi:hypothetical protein